MPASAFVMAFGIALLGGQRPGGEYPSNADIGFIEAKITLPSDALGPLPTYDRYYAWTLDNGKKYIYAVYISNYLLNSDVAHSKKGRIHVVTEDEIPDITNGGCGVITFYFDPRRDHMPSLYCNPVGPAVHH